ncbi:hypothetical protein CP98_05161 [Sphingobium yanoikuyae]|jgi:hypothetical protein|uniref:Uncharacterized protein n=1 Tax=Sphingobium yanoikuyae TaxID=13690 RepID=A0A084E2E5_SPHYA|nr:hypothetical protein CP98_05161 [Sphingobium yanoikuyae]
MDAVKRKTPTGIAVERYMPECVLFASAIWVRNAKFARPITMATIGKANLNRHSQASKILQQAQ